MNAWLLSCHRNVCLDFSVKSECELLIGGWQKKFLLDEIER
jgi:hypothetical protein